MMPLNTDDYTYSLTPDRIAVYPLDVRDQSNLLVYDKGQVTHTRFDILAAHLPSRSFLFFNDTKVIPARLHFTKGTGAEIEIFLLNPFEPSTLMIQAMQAEHTCSWKCAIGNLKRWKEGTVLVKNLGGINLEAHLRDRNEGRVEFRWDSSHPFAEIINRSGETPLPPYINRKSEGTDRERYQTIYSHYEGAVAAPTAGLHFTPNVFVSLTNKNIQTDFLTLHVSAGTFQPIKVKNAAEHTMHNEQIVIKRHNVENLLNNPYIVPVGTTSMRTIESIYWYGVRLLSVPDAPFDISQEDPYANRPDLPSKEESLSAVIDYFDRNKLNEITGQTSIYIVPGYRFRICKALITNFHQPGSTLILLVAAFIGRDWKKVYQSALDNNYRFLSYGDSSLLIPQQ
ncbi:MAG TPA: S-adenosylmethionine:tRNA ribosyltransferase-isomerase [Chryseolinea sp.]|nr:S-adenosylmethionine:tRNA ribosyltransferase-isomerase [Chryseolinea sp.]